MRTRWIAMSLALCLSLAAVAAAEPNDKEQATLLQAAGVLDALKSDTAKGIPRELFAKAECILLFPDVSKGAFIEGGKRVGGIASCRGSSGDMGSVAFYTVGGESIGSKIGGHTDFVLLIMSESGMSHLFADRFTLGADAASTAGPVGRTALTDAQSGAKILSWNRSGKVFVGATLDGSVVKPNPDANARLYGRKTSGQEILSDASLAVPPSALPVVESIRQQMASGEDRAGR